MIVFGCNHETVSDHTITSCGEKTAWVCSWCGRIEHWSSSWGYWGNIECRKCGLPSIEFVYCSDHCRLVLTEKHGL